MTKAIVTGHSRGLGAAFAGELLARSVSVLAIARTANAELAARFPSLQQVALDMADANALGDWLAGHHLQQFLQGSEPVLLINNAGMLGPVGELATHDVAHIARAVTLNVAAPLMLAAAFAAASPDSGDRRIVHVSSGAGRHPYPGWSIYCATKAALDQHALAVAQDAPGSLRICSLAPGVIDTDMQAEIRGMTPAQFALRERFVALKRDGLLISPADCAKRAVDYLLSKRFGEEPVADLRAG